MIWTRAIRVFTLPMLVFGVLTFCFGGTAAADTGEAQPAEVCLALVGDLMHHCTQSTGARVAAGGEGYDFRGTFAQADSLFSGTDLIIGNLETPIDGRREDHCFPRFSAPVEYLDALRDAGFDVLSVANNHALDRGSGGLVRTIERIRARNMLPVGASPGAERVVVERGGIEFVFLAATRFMNFPCRSSPCPVEIPPRGTPTALIEAIRAEAAAGRAVVLLLHWMGEYAERPRKGERQMAEDLVAAGASLVIGAHTHVLAPAVYMTPTPRRIAYVRYSLGNFVHAMKRFPVKLGGVDKVCLRAGPEGPTVTSAEFTPTFVRRNAGAGASRVFQPVSLEDALEQCHRGEGPYSPLSRGECQEVQALAKHLHERPALLPGALPRQETELDSLENQDLGAHQ